MLLPVECVSRQSQNTSNCLGDCNLTRYHPLLGTLSVWTSSKDCPRPTDPPGHWDGYDRKAFLLVGALSHSGMWRGQLCERADGAHLADALSTPSVVIFARAGENLSRWAPLDRRTHRVLAGDDRSPVALAAVEDAIKALLCDAGTREG